MAGAVPVYTTGNKTYEVSVAVTGGQLVVPTTGGKIGPAGLTANTCLGVAAKDAIPTATNQNPTGSILLSPTSPYTTVWNNGVWRLTAGSAITFGQTVKCGAAGTVVPWVSGTDAADTIVGRCVEILGIANAAVGEIQLQLT
jgi:hypothetical protein